MSNTRKNKEPSKYSAHKDYSFDQEIKVEISGVSTASLTEQALAIQNQVVSHATNNFENVDSILKKVKLESNHNNLFGGQAFYVAEEGLANHADRPGAKHIITFNLSHKTKIADFGTHWEPFYRDIADFVKSKGYDAIKFIGLPHTKADGNFIYNLAILQNQQYLKPTGVYPVPNERFSSISMPTIRVVQYLGVVGAGYAMYHAVNEIKSSEQPIIEAGHQAVLFLTAIKGGAIGAANSIRPCAVLGGAFPLAAPYTVPICIAAGSIVGGVAATIGTELGVQAGKHFISKSFGLDTSKRTTKKNNNWIRDRTKALGDTGIVNEETTAEKKTGACKIASDKKDTQVKDDESRKNKSVVQNDRQAITIYGNGKNKDLKPSFKNEKIKTADNKRYHVSFDIDGRHHEMKVREGLTIYPASSPVSASSCWNGKCDMMLANSDAVIRASYNKLESSSRGEAVQSKTSRSSVTNHNVSFFAKQAENKPTNQTALVAAEKFDSGIERLQNGLAELNQNKLSIEVASSSVSRQITNHFAGQSQNQRNGAQNSETDRVTFIISEGLKDQVNKQTQSSTKNVMDNLNALEDSAHRLSYSATEFQCSNFSPVRESKASTNYFESVERAQCLATFWQGYLSGDCSDIPPIHPFSGAEGVNGHESGKSGPGYCDPRRSDCRGSGSSTCSLKK